MSMIREHWDTLQTRERRMILLAGLAIFILLSEMLFLSPYFDERKRLEQQIEILHGDLNWMHQASAQVKQLSKGKPAARPSGQSMLSLVDSTAKSYGLGQLVKRVQPDGQNIVRIWLEGVGFDVMLRWLSVLSDRYGLVVTGLVVDRSGEGSELINARIVFEGAK